MKHFLKILFFGIFIFLFQIINAQISPINTTGISTAKLLGKTAPLHTQKPLMPDMSRSRRTKAKINKPDEIFNFKKNRMMPNLNPNGLPKGNDPLLSNNSSEKNSFQLMPDIEIEGMDQALTNVFPPDPCGDVGPNHYVQGINSGNGAFFQVYDTDGNSVFGPSAMDILWTPFNASGLGDPIVLYDQSTDRWLLSELSSDFTTMLIAISETGDPTGSYYAYSITAPGLPDYPKYAIWENSIFITTNEFSDNFIPVYAVDKNAMMNGDPNPGVLRLGGMDKFVAADAFQVATPADWDGPTPPPAGSPGYAVRIHDDSWDGGVDHVEVWELDVDWSNPGAASVGNVTILPTAPFKSQLCTGGIFDCLAQPDGTTLSALQHVVMYRVQYRNFGTHETLVFNFSVDVSNNLQAGIRWYELRKLPGGAWTIFQEGTFSPDDQSRFMGSIAMDGTGNIMLGYSVTGSTVLPTLRMTGRRASDPLGQMTFDEYEGGTGGGTNMASRWGDYAQMVVDPVSDRRFWFTGEYQPNTQWSTKIISVQLSRDSLDIGVADIYSPQNSGYLTATEEVTVGVRNFGYLQADSFTVSYSMDGSPFVTDMVNMILLPDSTYIHTFGPTVDMTAVGPYDFTIITSMVNDTTYYNDTLRRTIYQLPKNDAAVTGVEGIGPFACGNIDEFQVLLRNDGVEILTSADFTYQINGGTLQTFNWTGNLAPGDVENVLISGVSFADGNNTINLNVTSANGGMDEDISNNSFEFVFTYLLNGGELTLELLTDLYPNETTWELQDLNGNVLYDGGPYSDTETLYTEEMCVDSGCYTFVIYDSYGDGLAYGGVEGDYKIRNSNGDVVASLQNANFGSQEINTFCTSVECVLSMVASGQNESMPGANDGVISVQANGSQPPFEYSNDGGANFQPSNVFSGLSPDTYDVVVRDAFECEESTQVTIGSCTMEIMANVQDVSSQGSSDGSITISASSGATPYEYSIGGVTYQSSNIFENLPAGPYIIYVKDATGCLRTLQVNVSVTVNTEDQIFGHQVLIAPNPTSQSIFVEVRGFKDQRDMKVRVFDATGKTVTNGQLINYNGILMGVVSLKAFPNGLYFLQLGEGEKTMVRRVVKK